MFWNIFLNSAGLILAILVFGTVLSAILSKKNPPKS